MLSLVQSLCCYMKQTEAPPRAPPGSNKAPVISRLTAFRGRIPPGLPECSIHGLAVQGGASHLSIHSHSNLSLSKSLLQVLSFLFYIYSDLKMADRFPSLEEFSAGSSLSRGYLTPKT